MGLPIKTFWLLNGSIDRISAQNDMRHLTVAVSGQGGEAAAAHRQQLVLEIGSLVTLEADPIHDAVRDEEGFAELRKMAKQ